MKKNIFTISCAIALIFAVFVSPAFANITGSTLTPTTKYTSGETNTLVYRCDAVTPDFEYMYTVVVNYLTGMNVITGYLATGEVNGGTFAYNGAAGDAAIARWDSTENLGPTYGSLVNGESGYFTNEVIVDSGLSGDQVLTYYLFGDGYGAGPHGLTNTLTLQDADAFVSNPPTAVTDPAAPVTWDFAILRGVSNPNEIPSAGYFEYGPDTGYGSVSPLYNLGSGATDVDVNYTTPELTPGSMYHCRFVAYNVIGTNYGSDQVINTPASPMLNPPMFFQPLDIYSGVAACQLDSTQPFDARAADDFMYSNPTDYVYQVRWWTAEWNGAPPYVQPSAFNIYLYTNYAGGSGCYPTNVIKSWNIPVALCHETLFDTETGTYSYWAELSPRYKPQPGVHYWLTIQPVLDYAPQAGLKLAATDVNLCTAMQVFALAGLPDWTTISSEKDLAYVLYPHPVPEPAVLLVIAGLLLLLVKKR